MSERFPREPTEAMVQRVAEAICQADDLGPGCVMSEHPERERCNDGNCRRFKQARAALAVMCPEGFVCVPREPTWPMLEAGRDQDRANDEHRASIRARTTNIRLIWAAMLAAAQADTSVTTSCGCVFCDLDLPPDPDGFHRGESPRGTPFEVRCTKPAAEPAG